MIIGVTIDSVREREDKLRGAVGLHHEFLILQRIQAGAIWPASISYAERFCGQCRIEIIFPFGRLSSNAGKVPVTGVSTLAKS
jgi:hypothetical protein